MVSGSFTDEFSSPVAVERLWKAGVLDTHNLMPKIAPDFVTSVEVIEGNGGVGTVKKFNFTDTVQAFSYVTDRIEVLDNENHIFKYSVIDGGLIGTRLKSYSFEVKFVPEEADGDGKSAGKVTVEYETLDETDLTEEEESQIKGGVFMLMKGVEAFLLANPDAYA